MNPRPASQRFPERLLWKVSGGPWPKVPIPATHGTKGATNQFSLEDSKTRRKPKDKSKLHTNFVTPRFLPELPSSEHVVMVGPRQRFLSTRCVSVGSAMYYDPADLRAKSSPFQVLFVAGGHQDDSAKPETFPLSSLYFCDSCSRIVSKKDRLSLVK